MFLSENAVRKVRERKTFGVGGGPSGGSLVSRKFDRLYVSGSDTHWNKPISMNRPAGDEVFKYRSINNTCSRKIKYK